MDKTINKSTYIVTIFLTLLIGIGVGAFIGSTLQKRNCLTQQLNNFLSFSTINNGQDVVNNVHMIVNKIFTVQGLEKLNMVVNAFENYVVQDNKNNANPLIKNNFLFSSILGQVNTRIKNITKNDIDQVVTQIHTIIDQLYKENKNDIDSKIENLKNLDTVIEELQKNLK